MSRQYSTQNLITYFTDYISLDQLLNTSSVDLTRYIDVDGECCIDEAIEKAIQLIKEGEELA